MKDELDSLLEQIRLLEKRILQALQSKETAFFYKVREGKVQLHRGSPSSATTVDQELRALYS